MIIVAIVIVSLYVLYSLLKARRSGSAAPPISDPNGALFPRRYKHYGKGGF